MAGVRFGGVLIAVAALALSACGSQIAGSPVAEPLSARIGKVSAPADLPYDDEDKALAKAYATMRTWDVCALQDPEAVKGSLKVDGGSIAPYLDLSGCKMEIDTANGTPWEFQLDLQRFGATGSLEQPQQETVGGVTVYKSLDDGTGYCTYELPVQKVAAIALEVSTIEDSEKPRICDVAKDYLSKVLPKWQNPPKAGEGKTTPVLRMAGQDPCKGLVGVHRQLSAKASSTSRISIDIPSPYECELSQFSGSGGYLDYKVRFTMASPDELTDGQQVEISGLRGVSDDSYDCETLLDVGGRPITTSNQGTQTVEAVELDSPDCTDQNTLTTVAGAYSAAYKAPVRKPGRGALRLGDLNPPSTSEEVGAPFNPCTVVGWNDFPANVREAEPIEPYLAELNTKSSNVQTGCVFHGEQTVTTVGWGRNDLATLMKDQSFAKGGTTATVSGRDAVKFDERLDNGKQACTQFVSASKGVIAISTVQNYSTVNACQVNDALLPKIVTAVR
jgi:hypothetical protein